MKRFIFNLKTQILVFSFLLGISININSCKFKNKNNSNASEIKMNKREVIKTNIKDKAIKIDKIENKGLLKTELNLNNNEGIKTQKNDAGSTLEDESDEPEHVSEENTDEANQDEDGDDDDMEESPTQSTASLAQLSFVDKESKIHLPEHKGRTLPTVSLTYANGPTILPHEYKAHREFDEDIKSLRKAARRQMKRNFQLLKEELYTCSNSGANKGETPIRYKVRVCKINKPKSGLYHYFQWRKATKARKRATRATLAYTRSSGECKNYKSLVLLNILRPRSEDEDKIRRIFRKIFTFGRSDGNDPKKTTLCINDGTEAISPIRKRPLRRDKDIKHITPENTKLELVKMFIVRRTMGRAESFPIQHDMHEIDESTLLCYNAQIIDQKKRIIRKRNEKVYIKVISVHDWIGPLNSIPESDYVLEGKKKSSWKKTTKTRVEKKISPNTMVFASTDFYDVSKNEYKGIINSELENDNKPTAEFMVMWRLVVGGVCIGVIPAVESYVVTGTEDWGQNGGFLAPIKRFSGKVIRGFNRLLNKLEIHTDLYE